MSHTCSIIVSEQKKNTHSSKRFYITVGFNGFVSAQHTQICSVIIIRNWNQLLAIWLKRAMKSDEAQVFVNLLKITILGYLTVLILIKLQYIARWALSFEQIWFESEKNWMQLNSTRSTKNGGHVNETHSNESLGFKKSIYLTIVYKCQCLVFRNV